MRNAPILYRSLRRLLPPIVDRYFKLKIEGLEQIPTTQPVILASNHLSFLDSVVLPIHVPRPVYFLGKSDYWDSWRTRWFFQATGVVPVDRSGEGRARDSLKAGVRILRQGDLLGVYPEGTRSPDGRLYRGKTGPVRLALEAEVPIIPCAVFGTEIALPPGHYRARPVPVSIRYGEPLDLSRYQHHRSDPSALRAATDELMTAIGLLSGQQYVDEYAARIKAGDVEVNFGTDDDLPDLSGPDDSEGESQLG